MSAVYIYSMSAVYSINLYTAERDLKKLDLLYIIRKDPLLPQIIPVIAGMFYVLVSETQTQCLKGLVMRYVARQSKNHLNQRLSID